jgi:hypothetical protein
VARARSLAIAFILGGTHAATAAAQQEPTAYPELRADAIFAGRSTAQGGVGIVAPVGVYVRFALDGAFGTNWHDGTSSAVGRIDAIARFLLDPLRENDLALSVGGGLSAPITGDGFRTPDLTLVLDVEGQRHGGWTPGVELGLGGGARIGFVLRRSPPRWR